MKNFYRISQGHDVQSLADVLKHDFWSHYDNSDVRVAALRKPETDTSRECVDQPILTVVPAVIPYIFGLMSKLRGERLGTVLLVKLAPGRCILPHADMEGMEKYYDRFHIVLQTNPLVSFHAGSEEVHMEQGDIWWFDHTAIHSVYNNGTTDRVHLIIDIKIRNLHV